MITIAPESRRSFSLAVTVRVSDMTIAASYPQFCESLIAYLKQMGYRWDSDQRQWSRTIDPPVHGDVLDRTIELIHGLLIRNFAVDLPDYLPERDHVFLTRVAEGDYQTEQRRWIDVPADIDDVVQILWGREEDLYADMRRRIPEVRPAGRGTIYAQTKYYDAIRDVAGQLAFRITDAAEFRLSDAEARRRQHLLMVTPRTRIPSAYQTTEPDPEDRVPLHLQDEDGGCL